MGLAKFHPPVYPHFLNFDLPTADSNFHQTSTKPDDKDIEASHQLNNPCPYEARPKPRGRADLLKCAKTLPAPPALVFLLQLWALRLGSPCCSDRFDQRADCSQREMDHACSVPTRVRRLPDLFRTRSC